MEEKSYHREEQELKDLCPDKNEKIKKNGSIYEKNNEKALSLLKDMSKEELERFSMELIERKNKTDRLISKLGEKYTKKADEADRECLTGLYNHKKLKKELEKNIKRTERFEEPFSLLVMDLNNFKYINDTYGHSYGDKVLREVSDYLNNNIRNYENAFRQGGDEFAVLLEKTDIKGSLEFTERMCSDLQELEIWERMDNEYKEFGASIGVVNYNDINEEIEDSEKSKMIYDIADEVMYHSKNSEISYIAYTEIKNGFENLDFELFVTEKCERSKKDTSNIANYWSLKDPDGSI